MLSSFLSSPPQVYQIIVLSLVALASGGLFAFLYSYFKKRDGYYKDMIICYTIFPFIVTVACIVVTLITNQCSGDELTARFGRIGVALLSALLILRFRSEPRNFEDLTYLFFLCILGLLLGTGYLYIGIIVLCVILLVMFIFYICKFPRSETRNMLLHITIPENLNYPNAFDDIFNEYTDSFRLVKVKTADLGSVFILIYEITMKKDVSQKDFIDKVRTRNSNLNIVLTLNEFKTAK